MIFKKENDERQAEAELCQAQVKLWLATVEVAFIKDKI